MSQASQGKINNLSLTHVEKRKDAKQKPLDMKLMKRLFGYTSPYRKKCNLLIVMTLLRSFMKPGMVFWMAYVLNKLSMTGDSSWAWTGGIVFFALMVFRGVLFHFRKRWADELGEAVVYDLRKQIFAHLQDLTMSYFDKTKVGWIISRVNSDTENLRRGIQESFFVTIVMGGQMLFAAIAMLFISPKMFLLLLPLALVLIGITYFFRTRLSSLWRSVQDSFSRVTATLAESIAGIRITQGFVRQDVNAEIFSDLVSDHATYHLQAERMAGIYFPMLNLNSQLFRALLVMVGGYMIFEGGGTNISEVLLFIFLSDQFFAPIDAIGRQYNTALTAMAGAERVFNLLDREPDFVDADGALKIGDIKGDVEFRNLDFSYIEDKPVLKKISFKVSAGQTVALVGHTGSGKTTTISLVSKFYLPTAGELFIDGHEIRAIDSASLHEQMGIVLQNNFLFKGSVMENIRSARPEASDEEVMKSAKDLDVLDLIQGMSDGFETQVGEGGGNLSLGQRQIVCFARAMLADPKIMVLDEATSSVDSMTERRIQVALEKLLEGRTSFVVAHRLSTIKDADLVLVFSEGEIVERGTHEELLVQRGTYAGLYRQFAVAGEV